jgi:ATP-dependent Lon protease
MLPQEKKDVMNDVFGKKASKELPVIPLRDTVVFPRVAAPIMVKRGPSVRALEEVMQRDKVIVLVAQKDEQQDEPKSGDLHTVATLAKVRELVKQEDGTIRLLAEGLMRVRVRAYAGTEPYLKADVEPVVDPQVKKNERVEALMYSVLNQFRRVVNMGANVPFDVLLVILNVSDPWLLGDLIAANVEMKVSEKQEVLEARSVEEKLDIVGNALGRQIKVLQMATKIQQDTGKELDKLQREVFLREQLKSIEKELESIGGRPETDDLKEKIETAHMPAPVREKADKEYRRLQAMPSFSPEQSYVRTYLEWLCDLPWDTKDKAVLDIKRAKRILDEDHYGLEKVKQRILEYLAVQKLVGKIRGPILCFVGPPGTGKTSIGKSIARAMGRKFHRMSLGGVRDEAEIRGHRRTYVGALPGRIIQGISGVGTENPVFMLDEIDKVGADFRGDPSSALLEALDPEQNAEFTDHYLEVPYDLSDVMFVTTANMLDTIPPALRDRMEVIEFPGYTEAEKLRIAKDYLVPKAMRDNGLKDGHLKVLDPTLLELIRFYTREAGVRNLERKVNAVCRKVARKVAEKKKVKATVAAGDIATLLGPRIFSHTEGERADAIGAVTGLAWTQTGGEILTIEATRMSGKGQLLLTGQLGDVMKESGQAAYSFVRSLAPKLGVKDAFYKDDDIHIHVPEGAIPKDGPSAGVSMATALTSLFTGLKVDRTVAMTGEVTLRGRVLEIGGLKEKVLAAHRAGLKKLVIPAANKKDMVDVPDDIRRSLTFVYAETMDDVLKEALKGYSGPRSGTSKRSAGRRSKKKK